MSEANGNGNGNGNGHLKAVLVPVAALLLGGTGVGMVTTRDDQNLRDRVITLEVLVGEMNKKLDKYIDLAERREKEMRK